MGRSSHRARPAGPAPTASPSLEGVLEPRSWQGVAYRPLQGRAFEDARALMTYAAVWVPAAVPGEAGWGAWMGDLPERLVGATVVEPHGAVGMIHGPVVVDHPDPVEVAAQLVAATLAHATALRMETLFARPQGLDRVWVRFGFIPVPEADLPTVLKRRPGTGLFAWRGGRALWSSRPGGAHEP